MKIVYRGPVHAAEILFSNQQTDEYYKMEWGTGFGHKAIYTSLGVPQPERISSREMFIEVRWKLLEWGDRFAHFSDRLLWVSEPCTPINELNRPTSRRWKSRDDRNSIYDWRGSFTSQCCQRRTSIINYFTIITIEHSGFWRRIPGRRRGPGNTEIRSLCQSSIFVIRSWPRRHDEMFWMIFSEISRLFLNFMLLVGI